MSAMAWLLGVLVVLVGVAVSIGVHELGHLVPAKRFGVKCTQYMIGMGPTLWSRRRGETEYGIKAIPLGGYVRMLGMLPPARQAWRSGDPTVATQLERDHPGGRDQGYQGVGDDDGAREYGAAEYGAGQYRDDDAGLGDAGTAPRRRGVRASWGRMIEQARRDSFREVRPEDDGRLFYQRSVGKRLVIMLGGPTMNLVLATVLITIVVCGFGVPTVTTKLDSVSACVQPANAAVDAPCTPSDPIAPAKAAGLKPGDRVLAFDGHPVKRWDELSALIRPAAGRTVVLTVERDGRQLPISVTPRLTTRDVIDSSGHIVTDGAGRPKTHQVGFVGMSGSSERVRASVLDVPGQVGDALGQISAVVLTIPQRLWGVIKAVAGDGQRDVNSPISLVGMARIAGEASTVKGTPAAPVTWIDPLTTDLMIVASLNLALFVFNLIPLLPLDGGHVAGALWEGLRRRFARLLHRPDPGPVDVARALPLAYGVVSLLIGMSVLLIYADIVTPIRLGG